MSWLEMFKWWRRRLYMRLIFREFTIKLHIDINNTPGDIWVTPHGKRMIYMGKDWYTQMISEDDEF